MFFTMFKYAFRFCVFASFVLLIFGVINMKLTLFKTFHLTMDDKSSNQTHIANLALQNISSPGKKDKRLLIDDIHHETGSKFLDILNSSNQNISKINTTKVETTGLTKQIRTTLKVNKTSMIEKLLQKPFLVPNIVHYILFRPKKYLRFHEMIGILSSSMFIKPEVIKFHCDVEPIGVWWRFIKSKVKNLKIVKISQHVNVFGVVPDLPETKSDVIRLMILKKEGGIYLDFDVISIHSFDDLRKHEFTMGIEYHGNPGRLNNGIIISAPNARFLNIWINSYKTFKHDEWDEHSCQVPYNLRLMYPDLIHVEENTLNYPSGPHLQLIYFELYNWKRNYAMHLWYRMYLMNKGYVDINAVSIRTMNNTIGQLARRVFYNTTELL